MNKELKLTKRQEEILEFIKAHIRKSGFPPTITETQQEFSFKSPNAVQEHLKALARKGWIRRNPNKWRGVEVVGTDKYRNGDDRSTVAVPMVGRVAAGSPLLAQENIEGTISVDRSLIGLTTGLFALRVRGDSMIQAGIYDGDIIIAQQQSVAENRDIVIALLGDEATVKRFHRRNKAITLQPENDAMASIKVTEREDFRILGKVIATLRKIL